MGLLRVVQVIPPSSVGSPGLTLRARWITRHWMVKWWIERVERGDGYQRTRVTMGPKENVYVWDGGHCFSVRPSVTGRLVRLILP